jgi:hypothetical protein
MERKGSIGSSCSSARPPAPIGDRRERTELEDEADAVVNGLHLRRQHIKRQDDETRDDKAVTGFARPSRRTPRARAGR